MIPKLRFGEYQGEWLEIKLKELIFFQRGYDITEAQSTNGDIPVYTSSGISYFHNKFKVVGPAVVTGRKGKLGGAYFIDQPFWPHDTTLWSNLFSNNDPKFAYWFIRRLNLEKFDAATSVPTLNRNNIHNLKIYIPTLPEQKKIVTFLTTLDTRIHQLSRKKALLEQYKKGVMQQIFSQEIRFKDEDGKEFPAWEEKKLGDVSFFIRNGLSLDQNSHDIGYKVTRIETISNGTIDENKVGYIETDRDLSSYKLEVGDILFSNINSVSHIGKVAYIDKDLDLYHGMNLLNIRINSQKNHSKFFYYLLGSEKYKTQFMRICNKAVSQASINQTELGRTEVRCPVLEEQLKISSFLTVIDTKIAQVNQQLEQNQTFKKGLLQQLFV